MHNTPSFHPANRRSPAVSFTKFFVGVLVIVAAALGFNPLSAQSATGGGRIEGRVSNQSSGAYLNNVSVQVEGTNRITATDQNGFFRFSGMPAGQVRVRATYVGLSDQVAVVNVVAQQVATVELTLTREGASPGGDKVVVLAKHEVIEARDQNAQTLALNQQRQSPNIKNVVAIDEYPTGSDDNIADFIRYIPGVSIGYSGKAGVSASLRGLPPETSTITVDGVDLAGSFTGDTRAVSLLAVPTTNISTIEVTKVPTPDAAANGLGGAINITTRSGFEHTKRQFKYNLFTSFNPDYGVDIDERAGPHRTMDSRPHRPSFEIDYLHPVSKSFAISLSAANKLNYNTNEVTTVGWNQVAGFQSSSSSQLGTQLVTVRSGRVGVDWKIGDKNIFNASVTYRGRDADQGTNGVGVTYGAGATGSPTFTQGAATGVGSTSQSLFWNGFDLDPQSPYPGRRHQRRRDARERSGRRYL